MFCVWSWSFLSLRNIVYANRTCLLFTLFFHFFLRVLNYTARPKRLHYQSLHNLTPDKLSTVNKPNEEDSGQNILKYHQLTRHRNVSKAWFEKSLKNALLSPNVSVMICLMRIIKWSSVGQASCDRSVVLSQEFYPNHQCEESVCGCLNPEDIRNPVIILKKTLSALWGHRISDTALPNDQRPLSDVRGETYLTDWLTTSFLRLFSR